MQPDREGTPAVKLRPGGAEERLRLLAECETDTAVLFLDPDGYVLACNAEAERLLHCREQALCGEHFHRLFFRPEDVGRGEPERELHLAATRGHTAVTRWYARPDGTALWASGLTAALADPDGRLLGFAAFLQDRTAEKLREWGPPGSRGAEAPNARGRLEDLLVALERCAQGPPTPSGRAASGDGPAPVKRGGLPDPHLARPRPQRGVHGEAAS
jgi:PAS domain S-box-containing protein